MRVRFALALSLLGCLLSGPAAAPAAPPQNQNPGQPQNQNQNPNPPAAAQNESEDEPDSPSAAAREGASIADNRGAAWELLRSSAESKNIDQRVNAYSAAGVLSQQEQGAKLLRAGLEDHDVQVRVATVVALGTAGNPNFIPDLRNALDDSAPEVVYAAAVALWKLHDRAGETILDSVVNGERKTSSGFLHSGMRQAQVDMQNPSTLAHIGAYQGAYALMGPFGMGLDAFRMFHQGPNAHSARVLAVSLLATPPVEPSSRTALLAAMGDKDYFLRAAAARALGQVCGKDVNDVLAASFGDPKASVRLMAAASYIRCNSARHAPAAGARTPAAKSPAAKPASKPAGQQTPPARPAKPGAHPAP